MNTARDIKAYFHQIKLEKLQLLHEKGSRNQTLEQEQGQQELTEDDGLQGYGDGGEEEEEEEEEEDTDNEGIFTQGIGSQLLNSDRDMFESIPIKDNEIINSVLQDLDDEEEDSFFMS